MEIKKQDAKDKMVFLFGEITNNSVESAIKDISMYFRRLLLCWAGTL